MSLLQIKLVLTGTRPPIWRRILVPADFSLAKLHRVLQIAMGWDDCHLHRFIQGGQQYSDPRFELEGDVFDERKAKLSAILVILGSRLIYEYDFGDLWVHELTLEEITEEAKKVDAAFCVDGVRACPPEDCGGVEAYYELISVLRNPEHPNYADMREWVGEDFDSEAFDSDEVNRRLARLSKTRR